MRLGTEKSSNDPFLTSINSKDAKIQQVYLDKIKELTKMVKSKVMLGDSSIIEQETFDPNQVQEFYQNINRNLEGWSHQDISQTNNEDVRRIFTKFWVKEGNYQLSGHLSLQYHVLLYYKPEHRVIECQKELSELIDMTKDKEKKVAEEADSFIVQKLQGMGYKNLDYQQLFEIFFEKPELQDKIYSEIEEKNSEFTTLSNKKQQLLEELDSFLVETYQTTPVLIDETRLISGEEGCLYTLDLEFVKNKIREGIVEPKKIPENIKKRLIYRVEQLAEVIDRHQHKT